MYGDFTAPPKESADNVLKYLQPPEMCLQCMSSVSTTVMVRLF